jgi:carbon storage regulator
MLVLTRKKSECIVIGRDIVVTVLQCAGKVVRLGIAAPREVAICRPEICERLTGQERPGPADQRREG